MYAINEVARLTGITANTLRYYEKIGLLPPPRRQNGVRRYDEQDLQFIRFIHGLKQTGMKLEHIKAFVEDGCLLARTASDADIPAVVSKRIEMLDEHVVRLEEQRKQLESVLAAAREKRRYYASLLGRDGNGPEPA
jgi:DNA-binding transcriptional MerR regulator